MLLNELFTTEVARKPPKKDQSPYPYNRGWEELNTIKQRAAQLGSKLAGTYQLFVPRQAGSQLTRRERRLMNLADRWAYDDQGNIKPNYEKWENEGPIDEAAPIIYPSVNNIPPGGNKPAARIWTSTAYKKHGKWTSDWNDWVLDNMTDWSNTFGYLYRVKPGALILNFDDTEDALSIYRAFVDLGVIPSPDFDVYNISKLSKIYPWNQIYKHFHGVHHHEQYDPGDQFTYGWDCESTAWLNTSFLELVGKVPVFNDATGG